MVPDDAAIRVALQERRPTQPPNTAPRAEVVADYLRRIPPGQRGINIGCGGMTFKDWLNIDGEWPEHVDIVWDLKKEMPFLPSGEFDAVHSEHFLEHVTRPDAKLIVRECFRALRPGGHIRIAVPGLGEWIENYLAGAHDPVDAGGDIRREFGEVFGTRCELFNLATRAWGHSYMYDFEELDRLLGGVGFVNVRRCEIRVSSVPLLHNRESRPPGESQLIVEGQKPD